MLSKALLAAVPLVTAGIGLMTFSPAQPAVSLDRVELLTAESREPDDPTAQFVPGYRYSSYPYSGYRYAGYSYAGFSYSGYGYSSYRYSGYGYSSYRYAGYGYSAYRYSGYGYSAYHYSGYHPGYRYR